MESASPESASDAPPSRPARLLALLTAALCGCTAAVTETRVPGPTPDSAAVALEQRPTPRLAAHGETIYGAYDDEAAMETLRFVDRFFRVRGNVGYQKSLARVRESLTKGDFGVAGDPDTAVETLELGPVRPTWTPTSARLELLRGSQALTLHAFADETEQDRATLLVGSRRVETTDFVVVTDDVSPRLTRGKVVLGRGSPRMLYQRFVVGGGAAGILTLDLEDYHQANEQPEVAQFGYLTWGAGPPAFGFSLSYEANFTLRRNLVLNGGEARIRVEIDVKSGNSAATTVEATIRGTDSAAPPVVFVAHVDEPGANDNASGVAALLELALTLRRELAAGRLPRPRSSLIFLWGQEIECSRRWLAEQEGPVLAALIFDMVGANPDVVGAPLLIEREPDPGAVWMRPPDQPSGWGSGEVSANRLRGSFLTDYVTAAIRARAAVHPGWQYRDHPFEGGSDHVPFVRAGYPALLVWHFPDDAYHTNLDRADRVNGEEMRRVSAALGAVAVGLASGTDADHAEILAAVEGGAAVRLGHVRSAARASLAAGGRHRTEQRIVEAWIRWYDEALESIPAAEGSPTAADISDVRARLTAQGAALLREVSR